MFIPRHWAKLKEAATDPAGKRYLLEIWGWSVRSHVDALAMAQRRLAELIARVRRGEIQGRYLYGERPLREEIVRSLGTQGPTEAVITRNSHGALVLNTAQVPFIDIDRPEPSAWTRLLAWVAGRGPVDPLDGIRAACLGHGGSFRIYRTRAGYRVLATDRLLDPEAPGTQEFLASFGADPFFMKLCKLQRSFRARLTPKPWRCECPAPPGEHPREDPALQARFAEWLRSYEAASIGFAACRYIESIGSSGPTPEIRSIVDEHDRTSGALSDRPLA